MKRITVTLTEEQEARLRDEAERRSVSAAELLQEAIDEVIERWEGCGFEPPGFIGISDVALPYNARDMDVELARTFGER